MRTARKKMEREEARDVTAPSPARRGTADMFHEVKYQFLDCLASVTYRVHCKKAQIFLDVCVCQIGIVGGRPQIGAR